ncbi:MAG: hypothetical protein IEMM0008_0351 [bacterium]|nr:MAG: hypothetical protein IEMM0008_0351 [bacterium]
MCQDLKKLHDDLDKAVCKAYRFKSSILKDEGEILEKLLDLNLKYAENII